MLRIRKIAALLLAVLTLASSSTFAVGLHFCGDHLANISLSATPEPCDMQKEIPPCHRQMKSSCCKDQSIQHEGNEFSGFNKKFELNSFDFILPRLRFLYQVEHTSLQSFGFSLEHAEPPLPAINHSIQFRMLLI